MSLNIRPFDFREYAKEHLAYEANTFAAARDLFFQRVRLEQTVSREMMLVGEACLLHFRNLLDFFYPAQMRDDDVTAANYVPGWNHQISPDLEKLRTRTNKELAHLTRRRIDGLAPEKSWDFGDMSVKLTPVIEEFIKLAAPHKRLPEEAITAFRMITGTRSVTFKVAQTASFNSSVTSVIPGAERPPR
jgi:hypothetical protein